MKCCWNELSKRTTDWVEIRMTIEDQLTLQRNWNLHPRNPNPDMTGWRTHTGQEKRVIWRTPDRSEWKLMWSQLRSSLQQQVRLQHGQHWSSKTAKIPLRPWASVTPVTRPIKPKPGQAIVENRRESLAAIIVIKEGIWPETAVYLRRIEGWRPRCPGRSRRYARRWWCRATRSQGILSRGNNCRRNRT